VSEAAVTDAEVVEEPGSELVPTQDVGTTLFRTTDPAEVLVRAGETAEALMPVIREKGLVSDIQGREYLRVEAWTTLGAMLGVTPVCVWTRRLDKGWEARVEARTLDGRVVGAAEAECLRDESKWRNRDDFAIRSMAQTRATSKALASVLRFVATLGGAAGTPAEEMVGEAPQPRKQQATAQRSGPLASTPQKVRIANALRSHGISDEIMGKVVDRTAGVPLTKAAADELIARLEGEDAAAQVDLMLGELSLEERAERA
jgi:hypothetical protein